MISEGTDIPRLQVCCHLSRITTELYFRQVLGRILRITEHCGANAWLYTFAEPQLVEFANRVAEEIPCKGLLSFESLPKNLEQYSWVQTSSPDKSPDLTWDNPGAVAQHQNSNFTVDGSSSALYDSCGFLDCLGEFRQKLINFFETEIGSANGAHTPKTCFDSWPKT